MRSLFEEVAVIFLHSVTRGEFSCSLSLRFATTTPNTANKWENLSHPGCWDVCWRSDLWVNSPEFFNKELPACKICLFPCQIFNLLRIPLVFWRLITFIRPFRANLKNCRAALFDYFFLRGRRADFKARATLAPSLRAVMKLQGAAINSTETLQLKLHTSYYLRTAVRT